MNSPLNDCTRQLLREIFDPAAYAWLYEDVAAAVATPGFDPFTHYVESGVAEGRSPGPQLEIEYVRALLTARLRREFDDADALQCYAELPQAQRFVPNRWFSPWGFAALYGERYPELATLSEYETFRFYLSHYRADALSPSGVFSEEAYRARYADVAHAVQAGRILSGFLHFSRDGWVEGRSNLPGFGEDGGVTTRGAEAAFVLGREPLDERALGYFDEEFYRSVYPDVQALLRSGRIRSGLEHFMVSGAAEGRVAHPAFADEPKPPAGVWEWLEQVQKAKRLAARLSLRAACELRDRICRDAGSTPASVTAALWPYVARPTLRASLDVERYLRINPDIRAAVGSDPVDVQRHWETFGFAEGRVAPGTNLFGLRRVELTHILDWRSGVNFFAPVSSTSGLGQACRGYLAALRAAHVPVAVYDISALFNAALPADLFHADGLPYSINFFFINADHVISFVRRYGNELFHGRANIAAWVWELAAPLPAWRSVLSAFDLIVVPSTFVARSFATFTDTPIRVVPYAVDAPALQAAADRGTPDPWCERLEHAKAAGRQVVLFIMDASSYTARKGLDVFRELAAQCHAAHPERFLFVVKTHSRDYSLGPVSRLADPGLLVIDVVLEFDALCRLKALADVFVSPHRSEGFGLNIFESVLLGVPTLSSAYAGPVDLLGTDYPHLIPGKLAEVGRTMGPYRAGAVWFEPDLPALRERLIALADAAPSERPDLGPHIKRIALALAAPVIGKSLRRLLELHAGYQRRGLPQRIERFIPLAHGARAECYDFEVPAGPGVTAAAPTLADIQTGIAQPFFSIITRTCDTAPDEIEALYHDLIGQTFSHWEWCIVDDASGSAATTDLLRVLRGRDARIQVHFAVTRRGAPDALNDAVETASGTYLAFFEATDRVSTDILATYKTWLDADVTGVLIYCNEEFIDDAGQALGALRKPAWSYDHLLCCMYIGRGWCIRKRTFLTLTGFRSGLAGAHDHDLALRAAAAGTPVWHVDAALYRRRHTEAAADPVAADPDPGLAALQQHLAQLRIAGSVEAGLQPRTYRVRPRLGKEPVSINILAAPDKSTDDPERSRFVEELIDSIQLYPPMMGFQLRIFVDAAQAAALKHLETGATHIRLVPHAASHAVTLPALANLAVRTSRMERVVLLRDSLRATDDGWLEALMECLEIPGVGAVGGKILRPDGALRHAGLTMGGSVRGVRFFTGGADDGGATDVIRNCAAVSGAMLGLRRSAFLLVGGFDETLSDDLSDADFCLKLNDQGLRTVYTPHANMLSFDPGFGLTEAGNGLQRRHFERRWPTQFAHDPYYNSASIRETMP
jgi:Glycosyl transferase family 2